MRLSEKVETTLLAPCGVNCTVCYKHLGKKPCAGCLSSGTGKPAHCRTCKIKDCTAAKGISHCFACEKFPCKRVKNLDSSYRTRYGASVIENSIAAKKDGIAAFLKEHIKRYTCPDCGGVISLHDRDCSECGKRYNFERTRY